MSLAKTLMNSILEGNDVRNTLSNSEFLSESVDKIYESVAGMTEEEKDILEKDLEEWGIESGRNGWDFITLRYSNDVYAIKVIKNPIADFQEPIYLEKEGNILNVEVYFEPGDVYCSASGPYSKNGLNAAIRDLSSQEQAEIEDFEEEAADPNFRIA